MTVVLTGPTVTGSAVKTGGVQAGAGGAMTDTLIGNPIPVGLLPDAVAYDPANGNLYVAHYGTTTTGTVSVINPTTNTPIGSPIAVGYGAIAMAYAPTNGVLYVLNQGLNNNQGSVSMMNTLTNTVIGTLGPAGSYPNGMAYDAANGSVYVATTGISGSTGSPTRHTSTYAQYFPSMRNGWYNKGRHSQGAKR